MPLNDIVEAELTNGPIELLPIRAEHVLATEDLPQHHNDPFDRMLFAPARTEDMKFVTADRIIGQYASDSMRLWSAFCGDRFSRR